MKVYTYLFCLPQPFLALFFTPIDFFEIWAVLSTQNVSLIPALNNYCSSISTRRSILPSLPTSNCSFLLSFLDLDLSHFLKLLHIMTESHKLLIPQETRASRILVAQILFMILALAAVFLFAFSKRLLGKSWRCDDYLIIAALVWELFLLHVQ